MSQAYALFDFVSPIMPIESPNLIQSAPRSGASEFDERANAHNLGP